MKKAQKVLGKYGFCAGAILDLMACFCFVQVLDQASKKIQEFVVALEEIPSAFRNVPASQTVCVGL